MILLLKLSANFGLRNIFFTVLVCASCTVFCVQSVEALAEQVRGVWIECEGSNETLSNPKKLDEMIQIAEDTGTNSIFLQVYRHNRSWYNSKLSDTTPFRTIWNKYGIDPLSYSISKANKKNIDVHAWINVYRIGKDLNAPIIKELGRDVITRDGSGRSMVKYSLKNLPDGGYWLDPGDPRVHRYLLDIVKELLEKYPNISGIHLDFIRYPYKDLNPGSQWSERKDFGYGKKSVDRFKSRYGFSSLSMDLTDRLRTQQWDEWRRSQITEFVRDVYSLCKKKNPKIEVSVAVQPWPDRAYMVAYQDWRTWLKKNIVDFVILMNYSTDRKMARHLTQAAINLPYTPSVYIGLGAYLMLKIPQRLYLEISDCQDLNANGIVLFSYDAILKNKAIFKAIKQNKWWKKN